MPRSFAASWVLVCVFAFGGVLGTACGADQGGTGDGGLSGDGTAGGGGNQLDDGAAGDDGAGGQVDGANPLDDGAASDDGASGQFDGANPADGGDATLGQGAGSGNPCVPPSQLTISPGNAGATVISGAPFAQTFTATAAYANNSTADVTTQSFFSVGDANVGSVSGATFQWGGVRGGVVTVSAKTCGVTASTTFTLKLSATFSGNDGGGPLDAGGAGGSGPFQDAGSSTNASCNPALVYPPDGVLLPPNTNVIEIHFQPGSAQNTQFEISFENAVTDVRIDTACNPLNGGCVFELSQAEWDYIAHTNAGGDPVTVQVRGLGCDANNAASSNTRKISFAQQPLVGTLYYWASINAINNQATFSGGVFRYDFGVRGQAADPVLTPTHGGNGLCIGCHDISRDGRKMLFDYDDNDADDEYSDVNTDIFDVPSRTFATQGMLSKGQAFEPGFHTWNRSHSVFLLSDGANVTMTNGMHPVAPNGAFTVLGEDARFVGFTPAPPAAIRGTTPDMAPDDTSLVFAAAPNVAGGPQMGGGVTAGYWAPANTTKQDEWFSGASLYVAPWSDATNQLGAERLLLPSNGTNNFYYPSYSPEGSLIAFNYAPSGPNFHNPLARVQLVPAGVGAPTPDDLPNLNSDPTNGGQVTNSWARWAPFVQSYKGAQILWLTMSSTRDYGLRIQNDGRQNCYPKESPKGVPYDTRTIDQKNLAPGCTRAQLWMAAIRLDAKGVAAGQDVSFPAFWLPFQDITTNNHLGQWAQRSYTGTCNAAPDAGAVPGAGGCAAGLCCDNGACAPCLTPPPPAAPPTASCAIDANCATGTCCLNGSCGVCPDAGTPDGGNGAGDDGSGGDAGGTNNPGSDGGTNNQGGDGGVTCTTCLDCNGQACGGGQCGSCSNSSQCCAPLTCASGTCVLDIPR